MNSKYRVHEVAKDLNVSGNEIIELLAKYFDAPKKHQTALTKEELNVIFEHYTNKNQVKDFNSYFATAANKTKKEQPKTEPKARSELLKPPQRGEKRIPQPPKRTKRLAKLRQNQRRKRLKPPILKRLELLKRPIKRNRPSLIRHGVKSQLLHRASQKPRLNFILLKLSKSKEVNLKLEGNKL